MSEPFVTINLGIFLGGPLENRFMQIEPDWELGSALDFYSESEGKEPWTYRLVRLPASGQGAFITADGAFYAFDDEGRTDIIHVARWREDRIGHALLHRPSWESQSPEILAVAEQEIAKSERPSPLSPQVTRISLDTLSIEDDLIELP